jgi:hypothetical protein
VGHRVGIPRRAACRVRRERECVFWQLDAKGLRVGSAALEALAEKLAGQKVQRQDAAFTVLRRLLDPVPLLDDVIRGDPDLLTGEVEPVLAQHADLTPPSSGRDRGPQVQAEFLVLSPHEVEQPCGLIRARRIGLALARMRRAGVLSDVALGPVAADGQVQGRGDHRVDPQDRCGLHRLAHVRATPGVTDMRPGGAMVTQWAAPRVTRMLAILVAVDGVRIELSSWSRLSESNR